MTMKGASTTLIAVLFFIIPLSLWSTVRSSKSVVQPYQRAVRSLYVAPSQALVARNNDTSTSNNNDITSTKENNDNNKKKPLLILHVGPGKTGTTSVQWFAEQHSQLLEKDNFYYLVQQRHSLARLCKNNSQLEKCNQAWAEFDALLKQHLSQGHNVFVSEEGFSSADSTEMEQQHVWDRLLPLQKKWRVRVIFTYRRYHEWLPSKWFQGYNPHGPGETKRNVWPDEGGNTIPSLPQYYESKTRPDKKFKHPLEAKRRWDQHFGNVVHVFNMHDHSNGDDFLTNFYCQELPEAKHACEFLKDESAKQQSSTVMNSSSKKVLHFDMIAVAAYNQGLIFNKVSRAQARDAVEDFALKQNLRSVSDFPQTCLSPKQTEILLQQSLNMESEMVAEYFASPRGEEHLRKEFVKAVERNSFCSVDADQVLQDPQWKEFFRTLNNEQETRKAESATIDPTKRKQQATREDKQQSITAAQDKSGPKQGKLLS